MKKFLFIIVYLCFSFSCFAKDEVHGQPIKCDTVLVAEDISAHQIYNSVKIWFAKNMKSAQHVIQMDDAASSHIIGKAAIDFPVKHMTWHMLSGVIHFTIDVQAKDGRYKVKFYDFIHENTDKRYGDSWSEGIVYDSGKPDNLRTGHGKQYSEMQKRAVPLINESIKQMISSLEQEVANYSSTEDNNW